MNYIFIIAMLVGSVSSYFFGHHVGQTSEQAMWQNKELLRNQAEQLEVDKRLADNQVLQTKIDNDRKALINAHNQALKKTRDYYNSTSGDSLRISRNEICSQGLTTSTEITTNTGDVSSLTGTVTLPDEVTRNLRQLVEEADQVTDQARLLQERIKISY